MSSDGSPNGAGNRRSSITQAALSNLFQRGPSNNSSNGSGSGSGQMNSFDPQRRRLSVTTMGLSGTSPTNPPTFNMRRGSMSTNSDSIDENAIEDEDVPLASARTAPNTPFVRRMSFGASAMRGYRPGGNSPGNGNYPASPPSSLGRRASQNQGSAIGAALSAANRRASTAKPSSAVAQASNTMPSRASSDNANSRADQQGFNWSEQLRSRAETSVSAGPRASFSLASSPPRSASHHDRAKSVSDMMPPPVQAPPPVQQPKQEPRKPDAFQERILKGDFYMD